MVDFGPVVKQNIMVGNVEWNRTAYLMVTGKHREEGARGPMFPARAQLQWPPISSTRSHLLRVPPSPSSATS